MRRRRIFIAACMLAAVSVMVAAEPGTKVVQADNSACFMPLEGVQKDASARIMSLKGVQKDASARKSAANFEMDVKLSDKEQAELFKEYESQGIQRKDGVLYYNDKLVRCLVDTACVVKVNEAGGRTANFSNICTYINSDGKVDLCVVREEASAKAGGDKAFGKIKTVKQVSSIMSLANIVSAQSLVKIAEMEYAKGGISAISGLLPCLPSEFISAFAKDLAKKGSYSEIRCFVPFVCEDTVAEIVNSGYERGGISAVGCFVPYLSQESLEKFSKKVMNKNDIDALEYTAGYLNVDLVDAIVRKLDAKEEHIAGIAAFASADAVKELAESRYEKSGVSGIIELLPIMPKSMVNTFVNKAANKKDYAAVKKMAPYASKKTLRKVAEKMKTEGKSLAGLKDYIK